MEEHQFFRDRLCSLTPNGRPAKRPQRIVLKLTRNLNSSTFYTIEKPKTSHCIGLRQCLVSRPPLSLEHIATPSPCTYDVRPSSLSSKGPLCWISTHHINSKPPPITTTNLWIYQTNQDREQTTTPCSYNIPHIIGRQSLTTRTAPSYSMRIKTTLPLGSTIQPAPNSYNTLEATNITLTSYPSYTISHLPSHNKRSNQHYL